MAKSAWSRAHTKVLECGMFCLITVLWQFGTWMNEPVGATAWDTGFPPLDHVEFLGSPAREVMRTTTLLLFFKLVTLTIVPMGRVRCAAVRAFLSYFSPLVNGRPTSLSL